MRKWGRAKVHVRHGKIIEAIGNEWRAGETKENQQEQILFENDGMKPTIMYVNFKNYKELYKITSSHTSFRGLR